MEVRASLRSLARQPGAQVVKRRGRLYVVNKKNPRMKGHAG
ncbi:ribosomal protein bL36 [Kytococcus sp. Marseille-QA3725]